MSHCQSARSSAAAHQIAVPVPSSARDGLPSMHKQGHSRTPTQQPSNRTARCLPAAQAAQSPPRYSGDMRRQTLKAAQGPASTWAAQASDLDLHGAMLAASGVAAIGDSYIAHKPGSPPAPCQAHSSRAASLLSPCTAWAGACAPIAAWLACFLCLCMFTWVYDWGLEIL